MNKEQKDRRLRILHATQYFLKKEIYSPAMIKGYFQRHGMTQRQADNCAKEVIANFAKAGITQEFIKNKQYEATFSTARGLLESA